ncbi:MAG TPA: FAD-linked oxidase C-terminal domain-containing protein [Solirubrobacteraceae bacterium]|nr:FAD-linked oxidase C-terminal domain-containing protein [Solirubrobacteraceae bacterium]
MTATSAATAAEPDVAGLQLALERALDGGVRFDAYSRHLYARDASAYAIEPFGVCFPRHAADVAAATAVCGELGVPILPRGGGTSLAGQCVARALVLDLSRHMRRVVAVDPGARRAVVQPGVIQEGLNRALAAHGLMLGPNTSTANRATLGGMIGNNSAGSQSIRYGMTIDAVRRLDVVMADASRARLEAVDADERARRAAAETLEGAVYRELPRLVERHRDALEGFPRWWRQAGGYRLDRVVGDDGTVNPAMVVVGSEGTLATVVEAEVDLVPLPTVRVMAVGHFESTAEAIAATGDAMEVDAASVELLDRLILDLSRRKLEYRGLGDILEGDPDALLFVELVGDDRDEVTARLDALERAWADHGHGYHTLRAVDAADQKAVLEVRKSGLGLLMAASTGSRRPLAFVEDTAVPPDRLNDYVADFRAVVERHGLTAGFYGHCSVGCLHIRPFIDLRAPGGVDLMAAVAEEIAKLVLRYGGVNASEHGDGLVRSPFNRRQFGDELYEAMREVKRLFDPRGLLNPGKVVDAGPMTEHLRDPALPPAPPLRTTLHFDGPEGMRSAADRCMNIGLCRKTHTGVMCPSYMATLEEDHATRGRANALVRALSMPDPHTALGDERLHEILDLCLECKACKRECPLDVDMASLKSEFLSHYQEIHGTPLRSRVFGAIRALNRTGAALAPVSNWAARVPGARALLERTVGIAAERPLPRFERDTLLRWDARRARRTDPAPRGDAVLLADSFTTFTEPAIGRAAVELLERAGWRVRLQSAGCCGRASLSKGLLDQARRMADAMVGRLEVEARHGTPIVGVEPSCLLTLRDEYLSLLPGDARAEEVASRSRLVADLLVDAIDAGDLELRADSALAGRRIVFHGHCHEKAGVGIEASRALLQRIPGAEVVELDAGCCGMAGSFGFEAEHYEISRRVGELRLFPALRGEPAETVVAATGVSCRQQIGHFAGRRARHPVELVAEAAGLSAPSAR